jgi:hypothetical protein
VRELDGGYFRNGFYLTESETIDREVRDAGPLNSSESLISEKSDKGLGIVGLNRALT